MFAIQRIYVLKEIDTAKTSKDVQETVQFLTDKNLKPAEMLAVLNGSKGLVQGILDTQFYFGNVAQVMANLADGKLMK